MLLRPPLAVRPASPPARVRTAPARGQHPGVRTSEAVPMSLADHPCDVTRSFLQKRSRPLRRIPTGGDTIEMWCQRTAARLCMPPTTTGNKIRRLTMATKRRVGFIGVGLMGHGMAKNIVEKGHALTVLGHRNREPVDDLVKRGATEAKTAADVARRSDIVFLCVTASPQVEDIVFRKDGLLDGIGSGTIVADSSTAEPTSTMKVAAAIAERGGRFVDTPLVRTPKEAEEGRLVVMTG